MLASYLLILPLVIGLLGFVLPGKIAKHVAFVTSVIQLLLTICIVSQINQSGIPQFIENYEWIKSIGITFFIGLDGISAILVLLTNLLVPIIILSSYNGRPYSDNKNLYSLILLMQVGLQVVFMAYDCMLFYIGWELALIPVYFIAAIWGDVERKVIVTTKFFIYTVLGSLLMLAAILYINYKLPLGTGYSYLHIINVDLNCYEEMFVFFAFMLAFAIKIPIFPFHTWQPDTYSVSPTPATMLLSGIMLKMGFFGIIRWIIPVMPNSYAWYAHWFIVLGIIGIIYGSIIAIRQVDFKKMIAYSSIAHVGLITAGIFVGSETGMQGAVLQMFNHGINAVGIFFILDVISQRVNTREIFSLGGIVHKAPLLSIAFVVIMLGTIALPLTNGFAGEFLLLYSLFEYSPILSAIAGLSIILGAVYMLRMYKNVMLGESNAITENFKDLSFREVFISVTLIIIIITLGVYPNLLLNISGPTVSRLLESFAMPSCIHIN